MQTRRAGGYPEREGGGTCERGRVERGARDEPSLGNRSLAHPLGGARQHVRGEVRAARAKRVVLLFARGTSSQVLLDQAPLALFERPHLEEVEVETRDVRKRGGFGHAALLERNFLAFRANVPR